MGVLGKGLTLSSAEPDLGPSLPTLSPGFHCPLIFSWKLVLPLLLHHSQLHQKVLIWSIWVGGGGGESAELWLKGSGDVHVE